MTGVETWLEGRRPAPPDDLAERVRREVVSVGGDAPAATVVDRLAEAADLCLSNARSRPGRVRESAFDLLAADALLTYACEAALEGEDPEGVLEGLMALGRLR